MGHPFRKIIAWMRACITVSLDVYSLLEGQLFYKGKRKTMKEENTHYRITDFAESERPRERLARLGPKSLSNAELLAILLRVGVKGENAVQVAQRLLNTFDGVQGLHRAAFDEVCAQHGVRFTGN
jgi:hypothetical protein